MGGEGINSALMDGADIAWKLALVLRGAAKPSLCSTATRSSAGSRTITCWRSRIEIHTFIMQLVAMCADGEPKIEPAGSRSRPRRTKEALHARRLLRGQSAGRGGGGSNRQAGARRAVPCGASPERGTHHLVVFGEASGLREFRARWEKIAPIVDGAAAGLDAAEAGVPNGGAVLVRPDGFIGFRAAPADDAAMKDLDAHLATYLKPNLRADPHQ